MDAPEVEHSEGAEHRLPGEAAGAVRGHLVTSNQEVSDAVINMIVDRAVRRQSGAIAEVRAPASQQAIEPVTHLGPSADIAGDKDVADLGFQP